jgi:voltage-gated potassium channel
VLGSAQIQTADRIVIAVGRDDTAVLVTLTARQLNPGMTIIAAVREAENEPLLRQSGADHVVVSSDAAGRLLGLATIDPGAGQVLSELLDRGRGLDLTERLATPAELGRPAKDACTGLIALLRGDRVLSPDDPGASALEEGDRLVLLSGTRLSPRARQR